MTKKKSVTSKKNTETEAVELSEDDLGTVQGGESAARSSNTSELRDATKPAPLTVDYIGDTDVKC